MANTRTLEEIFTDALLLCQGLDADEPIEGAAVTQAMRRYNDILRSWYTRGLHQWRKQEIVLPLNPSQTMYLLGDTSTDAHWAEEEDFFTTTVTTAALTGAMALVVTDASDFTNSDKVGVLLDDGTRQWTTATKSGNTLTLTDGLTAAVSADASVYFYTTRPARPLRVIHARRRSTADAVDVSVGIEAHNFYRDQPAKTSTGTVVSLYYQSTLTSGRLFVWQPASLATQQLRLTVERPFTMGVSTSDIPDFPDEWNDVMIHVLATRLEPTYGHLDAARLQQLRADAARLEGDALAFDEDNGSLYFAPARYR